MKYCLLFFISISFLLSQEARTTAFYGGANINRLNSDLNGVTDITDLHIGMRFTQYKRLGVSFTLTFDNKTFKGPLIFGPNDELQVNYITLSAQFEAKLDYGFYYYLGPAIGYQGIARVKGDNGFETNFPDELLNKWRFSAIAGIGYRIDDFLLSVTYDYGFTDQLRDGADNTINSKFRTLQISLGYFVR